VLVSGAESTGGRWQELGFTHKSTKPVGSEAWRVFCRHGTSWFGRWRNRGTSFMATTFDSRCRNSGEGTGAVSRCNLDEATFELLCRTSIANDARIRVRDITVIILTAGTNCKKRDQAY
jgi:hypothetical protein